MKHLPILLFTLFLFSFNGTKAQQNHYIYIQTENKQPFYLKLDSKQYSSSISGYLIVPKLKDGSYNLTIGFPKSEWPEQNMVSIIANNDIGYLLKNFGDKGWGLFNLQSLAVTMAADKEKKDNIEVVNKTDAFSNMLSSVVNDSTIRQTETAREEVKIEPVKEVEKAPLVEVNVKEVTVVVPEAPKEELKSTEMKDESTKAVVAKEIEKAASVAEEAIAINEPKSSIIRSLFNKNSDGTEMIYVDDVNGSKDTVRVFIPADKNAATVVEEKVAIAEKPIDKAITQEPVVKQEEKAKDARFLEIELPNPNQKPADSKPIEKKVTEKAPVENKPAEDKPVDNKPIEKKVEDKMPVENKPAENTVTEVKEIKKQESKAPVDKAVEQPVQKAPMINSDCKNFAMEDDFLKLRKKMVLKEEEDEMVQIAKKVFKVKCFTVEQVKNLSALFLKDSGKYAFFDMAYPFAADSHNFHILKSQLTETYYIDRFQAMIRH